MNTPREFDSVRAAVLFGLGVGLGIAAHPAFFLFAAAIAMTALGAKIVHAIRQYSETTRRQRSCPT